MRGKAGQPSSTVVKLGRRDQCASLMCVASDEERVEMRSCMGLAVE